MSLDSFCQNIFGKTVFAIMLCSCKKLVDNSLIIIARRFYGRKKLTAVVAGKKDVENDDEFLDDSVL